MDQAPQTLRPAQGVYSEAKAGFAITGPRPPVD